MLNVLPLPLKTFLLLHMVLEMDVSCSLLLVGSSSKMPFGQVVSEAVVFSLLYLCVGLDGSIIN